MSSSVRIEEAHKELTTKWCEFTVAIRDIQSDFDQFYWIKTLSAAGMKYLLCLTRMKKAVDFVRDNRGHLIHLFPFAAMNLVGFILLAYWFILHQEVTVERWCTTSGGSASASASASDPHTSSHGTGDSAADDQMPSCRSSNVILIGVCYIGTMIIYTYSKTTFSSPGVLNTILPASASADNDSAINPNANVNANVNAKATWKSYQGQGGTCYLSFHQNPSKEANTLDRYCIPNSNETEEQTLNSSQEQEHEFLPQKGTVFIPNLSPSYCKKCNMNRPPRCHHCSQCNRCVLQMDHHCIWINNCIGYNNYRTFLLSIIYLVIGCWFGVILLFRAFYATIETQISQEGFKLFYQHKSGFLDLPMPMEFLRAWRNTGTVEVDVLLKMLVPIMIFAGFVLTTFLYSHLCQVAQGYTTLERMAKLNFLRQQALGWLRKPASVTATGRSGDDDDDDGVGNVRVCDMKVVNPFDQGTWKNFVQVLGSNPWIALLPMHMDPPPPFLPQKKRTKSD